MSTYRELVDRRWEGVEMGEAFFAFSDKQFDASVKELGLKDKKIYSAGFGGLYGTDEGLKSYFERRSKQCEEINDEIVNTCTPQEVYDYEFANHECGYVCDDEEAIKIVVDLFGVDRVKSEVKRRFGYYPIENK